MCECERNGTYISNLGVIATRTANFMPDRQILWLSFHFINNIFHFLHLVKKMKVETAKNVVRKEILIEKKESLLRVSREELSLDESSSSDKENELQDTSNINLKGTKEDTLAANENVDLKKREDEDQNLSEINAGDSISSKRKTDSMELKKYDILNDQASGL